MAMQDSVNPLQGASGPGKYSKRTDLEYQAPEYGDAKAMAEQIAGAPLAKTKSVRGATNTAVRQAAEKAVSADNEITSLYAPTARPQEPITHGVDVGPGAGSNILMMPNAIQSQYETANQVISRLAANPDASPTLQYLAQRLQQGF